MNFVTGQWKTKEMVIITSHMYVLYDPHFPNIQ